MPYIPIADIQETTDERVQPVAVQGPDGKLLKTGDSPADATYVKIVDEAGKTQPSGSDSASAITTRQLGALSMMNGENVYKSPVDFTAVHQAATVIQLSGGLPAIYDVSQFLAVQQISSAGELTVYFPHTHVFSWDSGTERLTVTGATFAGTDVFQVVVLGPDRAKSIPEDAIKALIQNPGYLYGGAVEVLVQENIPISTVTRYRDVSKYRDPKTIQVDIVGAGLTVNLYLSSQPGTDLTAKKYQADAALAPLTSSNRWVITYPIEALKFEFVSTVATDDVECYMSLR